MSEPYGFYLRARVGEQALKTYLARPVEPSARWNDWAQVGGSWTAFGWSRDGDELLRRVAGRLANASAGDLWVSILEGDDDCSTFAWNSSSQEVIIFQLLFAENLEELLAVALLCRGLEEYIGGERGGGMIVRDFVWNDPGPLGSAVSILFDGERSRVARCAEAGDAASVIALEEEAVRLAAATLAGRVGEVVAGAESPAAEQLRAFQAR